jgi:hypothetical protein
MRRVWGVLLSILLVLLLSGTVRGQSAQAQTVVWDGGGDGTTWSDPANWAPDGVPGPTDDVAIEIPGTYTVTFDNAVPQTSYDTYAVRSLVVGCAGTDCSGTQTLATPQYTRSLVLAAESRVRPAGRLNWSADFDALEPEGGLFVEGAMQWGGGAIRGGDTLHVATGGRLLIDADNSVDVGAVLENRGTTDWERGGIYDARNGGAGIIVNRTGGTFIISVDNTSAIDYADTDSLVNEGTFVRDGPGANALRTPLLNRGTIEVRSGTLKLGNHSSPETIAGEGGVFRAEAGGTLLFELPFYSAGLDDLDAASRIEGPGTVRFEASDAQRQVERIQATIAITGTAYFFGTHDYHLDGPVEGLGRLLELETVGNDAPPRVYVNNTSAGPVAVEKIDIRGSGCCPRLDTDVDLRADTLLLRSTTPRIGGRGTLTVTDTLDWAQGRMEGPGRTVVEGTMGIRNTAGAHDLQRELVIAEGGSAVWRDGSLDFSGSTNPPRPAGTLINRGVFDVQTGADIVNSGGLIRNEGTFKKTAGSQTDLRARFENEGTVRIDTTLDLSVLSPFTQTEGRLDVAGRFVSRRDTLRVTGGVVRVRADGQLEVVDRRALKLEGGALRGGGFITGDVINAGGVVQPGVAPGAPGVLSVQGTYAHVDSTARLELEIKGSQPGTGYDRLDTDRAELAGGLSLIRLNGYAPPADASYFPLRWTTDERAGGFDTVNGQEGDGVLLAIKYLADGLQIYDGSLDEPPAAPPRFSIKIDNPRVVRAGAPVPYDVTVERAGNNDAFAVAPIGVDVDGQPELNVQTTPCPSGDPYDNLKCRLERFGYTPPAPGAGESYPELAQVPVPASGQPLLGGGASSSNQRSFTGTCPEEEGSSKIDVRTGVPITEGDVLQCSYEVAKLAAGFAPGYDCVKLGVGIATSVGEGFAEGDFDLAAYLAANTYGAIECAGDAVPATKAIKIAKKLNDLAQTGSGLQDAVGACQPLFNEGAVGASRTSGASCVQSADPNDKAGPPGLDAERFLVPPSDSLRYVVFFENKPEATAPAQTVVVTDTIDVRHFDVATFELADITIGDTTLVVAPGQQALDRTVDLRPERSVLLRVEADLAANTGVITWRFTSLDPATGAPTTDPLAGFLPPNDVPPEGDGLVSYFAELRPAVPSGTAVGHAARIVFDTNAPIDTPVWTNTIDTAPPESAVQPLDAEQARTDFTVQWSGTDAGSGIAGYTVYVAQDGGPATVWLDSVTTTQATFEGQRGATYAFYSVAEDRLANAEVAPATPDAQTTVPPDALPVELAGFEARRDGDRVRLAWTTASETDNAGFAVERTAGQDGAWTRIGYVEGAGTTTATRTYRFVDTGVPFEAEALTYRLRQIDTDGTETLSAPVELDRPTPTTLTLHAPFPNPARAGATLRYAVPRATDLTLALYDALGRRVATLAQGPHEAGRTERRLDTGRLSSGVYFVRLVAGAQVRTQRLTVVR